MRNLRLVVLAIFTLCAVALPQTAPKLSLDSSKPFVYISFDHIGPRPPVESYEPHTGLWLRIVNNSAFPIEVITMEAATKPELTLVADEVVGRFTRIRPNDPPLGPMPAGYSAAIGSPETIASGKSILFSVPANHVSKAWYLRVPFRFRLSPLSASEQPICYAEFTLEDIPENKRATMQADQ
jgi:hypothetical protein